MSGPAINSMSIRSSRRSSRQHVIIRMFSDGFPSHFTLGLSRQREPLTKWLMEFPYIEYYSRNGLWKFHSVNTNHEMAYGISRQWVLLTKCLMEFPDSEYYSRNGLWNFHTVNTTHEMAYGISRQWVLLTQCIMEFPDSEYFSGNV